MEEDSNIFFFLFIKILVFSIERESIDITKNPIIYKIFNKVTEKVYIWKTTQWFASRWWQHFWKTNNTSPFIEDTNNHGLESWWFEIIEEIKKEDLPDNLDIYQFEKYILQREQYYIDKYNTVESWYNRRHNFEKKS